jgi:hypothetical protein
MTASGLVRRSGLGAISAGAMYALQGVILLFEPRTDEWSTSDDVVYSVFATAVLLTLVALLGLHSQHHERYGRLGLTGFCLSSIGLSCLFVTAVVRIVSGGEVLDLVFILGFLLAIVGYVLLGVAIFGARVLPRWSAPLPLVGALGAVLLQDKRGAGILMGGVWVLLGYVLWSRAREDRDVGEGEAT